MLGKVDIQQAPGHQPDDAEYDDFFPVVDSDRQCVCLPSGISVLQSSEAKTFAVSESLMLTTRWPKSRDMPSLRNGYLGAKRSLHSLVRARSGDAADRRSHRRG